MSVQYRDANGEPHDEKIHEAILSAVNFTDTPAYSDAIKRLVNLGLTETEAKELLTAKASDAMAVRRTLLYRCVGNHAQAINRRMRGRFACGN
jgi:hypothetical protein